MMSSSEVQRITLSAKKIVSPNGSIDLEDWDDDDDEKADKTEDGDENTTMEATTPISAANSDSHVNHQKGELDQQFFCALTHAFASLGLTNGNDSSPNNYANETITSSIGSVGDITIDSVRDHMNSTVTTLCSQTTEEVIGRLSVLSTSTNNTATSLHPKEILDVKSFKDAVGETNETQKNSVIVKSVITTISHGAGATNGDTEKSTTTTITRKESQF